MSNAKKPGMRVGAVVSVEDENKLINLFGYGVYSGDEPLPEEFGELKGLPNPKILLDTGETVWGCECWWGSEPKMKQHIETLQAKGYTIKTWTRADYVKFVKEVTHE